MKKITLLLMPLLSVAAYAYEPTIREDRIWEYRYTSSNGLSHSYFSEDYQLKFEGKETRNGKQYNVLKVRIKDKEDDWKPIGLMREDIKDKIIYVIPETKAEIGINIFGVDFKKINLAGTEIPLYNWGNSMPKVGEMSDLPMVESIYPASYEMISMRNWDLTNCKKVLFHDKRAFFGIEREVFAYDPWGDYDKVIKDFSELKKLIRDFGFIAYVEGIGNVTSGLLNLPCSIMWTSNHSSSDTKFLRQTDLDGHLTFLPPYQWDTDDVESISNDEYPADGKKYNLQGIEVEEPAHGSLYIQNGEKHIAK